MGTLKYMNLLLDIDVHLQSVKYIINEQSMNINVFLLFFSFVFLQIERERERVYKIGYKEKQSQGYLSYFLWWSSCGESFLFYGLIDFMPFFNTGLKKIASSIRNIFMSSSTRSTGFGSVCHEPCPTTNFFFPFFRWREEGATSVLGSQPITWLLSSPPLVGRFLRATRCHPSQVTEDR